MSDYLLVILLTAFFCSAIFWSIACASVALSSSLGKTALHLSLGFIGQFVWFSVVCIWGLIQIIRKPSAEQVPVLAVSPVVSNWDRW
jgi:hypothetical protein